MSPLNPDRQAKYEPDYTEPFPLPPPSPTSDSRTNTPNTNRKRAGDESSTQPPVKRQSNTTTSIDSQTAPTIGTEVEQPVPSSETDQAKSNATDENTKSIRLRIEQYKHRLQILEAERNAISQNGDPEAFNKAKRFLVTNHLNLAATVAKLHKIEDLIRQVAKVIRDCHDVVPAQLHQALQASVADRDSCHTELQKMTQLLKDAIDKDYETGVKFNAIERQIDELKSNLWMAEQDLTNTHLQQRLDALSHVKVSKLTYDQRLRLDKLVGQVTEVLNEEPGTLPHDLSITK
ncbi:hypothetical protein FPOAC2_06151 [Fusarium poae]|uniref:hypothetical protein n=1 Tax=Fusarium poae TaxID=36050 RepID=UPI001CE8BA2B|nr:hypothetical protein FPOAC1_006034 [Fusarium poae]KAG8672748.1 hypothetical protein FPOAC1_006034 [Fusarium poae]